MEDRTCPLAALDAAIATCTACPLHRTRTRVVPGIGSSHPAIVLLGEAPGAQEDRAGIPFVGPAGKLLDRLLGDAGIDRATACFTANTLKCRPPGNRDPEPAEIAACRPYLDRQLAILQPDVVVLLGRFAMHHFLPDATITRAHGRLARVDGVVVYPVFHPAAALRSPERLADLRADLTRLAALLPRGQARLAVLQAEAAAARPVDPA